MVRKGKKKMTGYCVMEAESMIEGDGDQQGEILPRGQGRLGLGVSLGDQCDSGQSSSSSWEQEQD